MKNCANNNTRSDNKKLYLQDLSKDVRANANASISSNCFDKKNVENVILIGTFVDYHTIGLRVVALGADSKTPAIKSTTEIYDDYLEATLLNLAPTFGNTYIKDEKREYFDLQGLDVDSENVLRIVSLYLQIHYTIRY
jgi:hypothetical protein